MQRNGSETMKDAIENLYTTFAHYRLGDDFVGCDCCVDSDCSTRLAETSLRDLTFDDLGKYAMKAMTTWGEVRHFKYFLPRLLELTIAHRDDFLDLPPVFGKLDYAQWHSWPERECTAVNRFFNDYWRLQLAQPILGDFEDSVDTVLCALANACASVQEFLDTWLDTNTDDARRHLAAFIQNNGALLLKKERLSNPFWNTNGTPHQEIVDWLRSRAVLEYLENRKGAVLVEPFDYAWPQLLTIRSSLGTQ